MPPLPILLSLLSPASTQAAEEPTVLSDLATVEALCEKVARPPVPLDEDEEPEVLDPKVFEGVYRAVVEPRSVRFEAYDERHNALPLALDKSLLALDGGLVLGVIDKRGAAFSIDRAAAEGLKKRAAQKRLRLAVIFQVDAEMSSEISPCFSYPMSETYSLRIAPLSYTLLDAQGNELARLRTDRMEERGDPLAPAKAEVRITTRVQQGPVDEGALQSALEAVRAGLERCVASVAASRDQTGVVGLVATISQGRFVEPRAELVGIEDPDAAGCLRDVVAAAQPPKAGASAKVAIVVSVDRDPEPDVN